VEKEIPFWVTSTHPEHAYNLIVFESGDSGIEEIDLSREEYIDLKRHLAAARGYTSGDAAERATEIVKEIERLEGMGSPDSPSVDSQQVATFLQTARALYRICPEAVVCPDGDFSATLEKLATCF
jgi:hypothetical protein